VYNMAQLQQLLEARAAAESAYHAAERLPENDIENAMGDENQSNAIIRRLYAAQQPWIQAAEAYATAIQNDNNATNAEKVAATDDVGHIDRIQLPPGEEPPQQQQQQHGRIVGGRRRRSASSRKSSLRRRGTTRSAKKRGTRRQHRARTRSRRAH
jgi:hypothetical protein